MKEIPLTNGGVALVDDEDFESVCLHRWTLHKGYVSTCINRRRRKLHQILIPDRNLLDHRNGNKLDNRRENLREATNQQNVWNSKARPGSSSFKGVSRTDGRWGAKIKRDGKSKSLGSYATEEEAALAYDRAAEELFGEFARLNFPDRRDAPSWTPNELRPCVICGAEYRADQQRRTTCGKRTCSKKAFNEKRKRLRLEKTGPL